MSLSSVLVRRAATRAVGVRTLATTTLRVSRPMRAAVPAARAVPRRQWSDAPVTVQSSIPEVNKATLEAWLASPAPPLLLDVRHEEELEHGVLPGAHNVPVDELDTALDLPDETFRERYGFAKPPRDAARIVCYCRSGVRAEHATAILLSHGYKGAVNYRGSFVDWFGHTYTI